MQTAATQAHRPGHSAAEKLPGLAQLSVHNKQHRAQIEASSSSPPPLLFSSLLGYGILATLNFYELHKLKTPILTLCTLCTLCTVHGTGL